MKDMVWSFSRLSSYEQCPYQFYLHYLNVGDDGKPLYDQEDNVYGLYGGFCHSVLEKLLTHQLTLDEALMYFDEAYDDAVIGYGKSEKVKNDYYFKGIDYFECFDPTEIYGTDLPIAVEKKLDFALGKNIRMTGIIDLLVKREDGTYGIIDHKSAKYPVGKRGNILATHAQKFENYKRQLYLYAQPVMEQYGEINYLRWNFFNDKKIYTIPFDKGEYYDTQDWAKNVVATVIADNKFEAKIDYYYCHNICEFRNSCEYVKESDSARAEEIAEGKANELHLDTSAQRFKQWSYQY